MHWTGKQIFLLNTAFWRIHIIEVFYGCKKLCVCVCVFGLSALTSTSSNLWVNVEMLSVTGAKKKRPKNKSKPKKKKKHRQATCLRARRKMLSQHHWFKSCCGCAVKSLQAEFFTAAGDKKEALLICSFSNFEVMKKSTEHYESNKWAITQQPCLDKTCMWLFDLFMEPFKNKTVNIDSKWRAKKKKITK